MTSKSLKRARHKVALKQKETEAAAAAAQHGGQEGRPTPSSSVAAGGGGAGVKRRKDWPRAVSEAMVAGRWAEALGGLRSMRVCGQVRGAEGGT